MKVSLRLLALLLVPVLPLTVGCETMQEHKTASGAIIGTATGAAAGALIGGSHHRAGGALIGAAAGAALGTGVGYYLDKQSQKYKQIEGVEVQKVPETQAPPAPAGQPTAQPVPAHLNLVLNSELLFDRNSSILKPEGIQKLGEIAQGLNEDPGSRVIVKGFTSSEGSEQHNLDLSQRRADIVRNQLVANRVTSTRIEAIGFGESNPIADNATEEGRMRNRRVEIEIIPSQQQQ